MEYAFNPPGGHSGIVISWLICGIFFILMGGLPLLVIIISVIRFVKTHGQPAQETFANFYPKSVTHTVGNFVDKKFVTPLVFILFIGGLAGGIYLGITIFTALTS